MKTEESGSDMIYSSAGFLALIIHLIVNHDVLWNASNREIIPAHRSYRAFLISVTVYYVTDLLWGLLYERGLIAATFLDTSLYFVAMASSIVLWTRYVVIYLKEDSAFGQVLTGVGWLVFAFQIIVVVANFFVPVLFSIDANGVYHAEYARYVALVIQIAMFIMTAVYALVVAIKTKGTMRLRHRTIALFSAAMAGFVTGQAFFPLLPLYAIGCVLGSCLLHSFVLENEKDQYRSELEDRLQENILKGNYYDLLTDLPGMSYFFELTQDKRVEAFRRGEKRAFLFLNLRGLKFFNQSRGFIEGDRLLRTFSQLLIQAFGVDNCSRFGQDHFAVYAGTEGLEDKLNDIFRQWKDMNGNECPAVLVGVYVDEREGVDISTACDLAKVACDSLRHTYVSSIQYYDAGMLEQAARQQYIVSHLDQAIAERWIKVYYQPIVRATSGKACDMEALARWMDPERGMLSPAEFIPILEEAKLIYKLDLYVVEQALLQLRHLREQGKPTVPQSINLSRSDFDACDIVEEIRRRVDEAGLPRHLLTIEITESIIGGDFDFIKAQVERFRSLGFHVWMDDFGSGYSSLDILQTMPLDLIKFDMRFMQQFGRGDKSKVLLTELVRMAVGLGLDTVCEGVEREEQAQFLREIGCSKLQGYYYAKPMPLEQIEGSGAGVERLGFENPQESGYFEAIGRVNLYDLASVAQDDEGSFRRYFSTVPMAIIEAQGDRTRFTRCNQAYRDFMQRTFHISISNYANAYEETPQGPGHSFVLMLHKCCDEGGHAVFDEVMPDGSTIHSFMRRIAHNPLTNTTAAAVAVLAITDAGEKTKDD